MNDGVGSKTPLARHTVVGAFDDTTHAARAQHDLVAAGFSAVAVPPIVASPTAPELPADSPNIVRATALGGAFLGTIVGGLVGTGVVPGVGPVSGAALVIAALIGAGLGAGGGALIGRPVLNRDARVQGNLVQVQVGGDRNEGLARALLARAGANHTWAYRVPLPRDISAAVLPAHQHPGVGDA